MACQINRDNTGKIESVKAPNGADSILYQSILKVQPDAEKAADLWLQAYTPTFKNWFGDWQRPGELVMRDPGIDDVTLASVSNLVSSKVDENGEPLFDFLEESGWFMREYDPQVDTYDYKLSVEVPEDATAGAARVFATLNIATGEQISTIDFVDLQERAKPEGMVLQVVEKTAGDGSSQLVIEGLVPTAKAAGIPIDSKIQFIIDKINSLIPVPLKVEVINLDQVKALVDEGINAESVNAFVKGGTVYLVEGRYNGEMLIEEMLHPVVYALEQMQPEVFNNLLRELATLYPQIQQQINAGYTSRKGFSQKDREMELVTRGLANLMKLKVDTLYEKQYSGVRRVFNNALSFVKDLFKQISKFFTGSRPGQFTIDQFITLMDNANIEFDPMIDGKIFYNLSESQQKEYEYVFSKANETQRDVLQKLLETNVHHDPVAHAYVDMETGETLRSTTSLIKGQVDDKYLLRMNFGNDFDFIMNSIAFGKDFEFIRGQVKFMSEDVAKSFYDEFMSFYRGVVATGSVVVPQLVQADLQSRVAGKLDMLVIDPMGNMDIIDLKVSTSTSVKTPKYNYGYTIGSVEEIEADVPEELRTVGKGSLFYGEKMSIRKQQGIQQQVYRKLIELKGLDVRGVNTLHFLITYKDNQVTGFKYDDIVSHADAIYEEVDVIVPTKINYQKRKVKTLETEQAKPENKEIVNQIMDTVDGALDKLKQRKRYFDTIANTTKGKVHASKDYMDRLQQAINTIETALNKGNPALAYYELVRYINNDVDNKLQKIKTKGVTNSAMLSFLLEAEQDLNEYKDYISVPSLRLGNTGLTKIADNAANNIDAFLKIVQAETRNYMKAFVAENTSKNLSSEELEDIIRQAEDISMADFLLGDLSTSTDSILANVDKEYKRRTQIVKNRVDEILQRVADLGNNLARLTPSGERNEKDMYKFMLVEDKNGDSTGKFVQAIGKQYWTIRESLNKDLEDENGNTKQYVFISNPNTASPENVKYNKELYKAKTKMRDFRSAERLDENGNIVDGTYHKYSDEFKQARAQYEEVEYYRNADGEIVGYYWSKKSNISQADYDKYKAKYFSETRTYLKPVLERVEGGGRVFNGRVVEESGQFPKNEYVNIREVAGDGTDMRDPKYVKLKEPKTELDNARSAFYEYWTSTYQELLDSLPQDVAKKMFNKIPLIEGNFDRSIKSKGEGFMKGVLKGMRSINIFDLKAAPQTVTLDENGNIRSGVPIFYTGDTQSESKINYFKTKIEEAKRDFNDKKITNKEKDALVKKYSEALRIEESRIKKSQISNDMVTNIVEFARMAENFRIMTEFESTVNTALRIAKERTYNKRSAMGDLIMNKMGKDKEAANFAGGGSLTALRLQKWMDMVLYNNVDPFNSKGGRLMRKFQMLFSLRSVGLNPFGQLNNYTMGRINNHIESYGGNLFARNAYHRSVKEFNTNYLPGWFYKKGMKLKAKTDKNSPYYQIPRSYSKYEALSSKFRMMRKMQSVDGFYNLSDRTMDMLYAMQESAEYNIQTKTGMAVLMTETLTNKNTGEKVAVYDAFEFNGSTGELTLRPDFELGENETATLTNKIYEVNKQIHGNYAFEDRMVIQQFMLGELAAQFHKWMYPMFKQKFKRGYDDENLGYIEGRYVTTWELMKELYNVRDAREVWDQLNDVQKGNIYKTAAELVYVSLSILMFNMLKSLAEDIDDDDELLGFKLRKLTNIFVYQSDRVSSELTVGLNPSEWLRMIKNPIAVLGYLGDLVEAFEETGIALTNLTDDEKLKFRSGVNKGRLKWLKEWEDVVPGLYTLNRYAAYENTNTFYVR